MESVTKHELFEMQKESLKKGNNKCHNNNNRKLGRVNLIVSFIKILKFYIHFYKIIHTLSLFYCFYL